MIELILGGARSGKSRWAENRVLDNTTVEQTRYYIATAQAYDEEMRCRIDRHQTDRNIANIDKPWFLIEEPLDLARVLENIANDYHEAMKNHNNEDMPAPTILIDCLTLWLTNCLCAENIDWPTYKAAFIQALVNSPCHIVLVSNEVGHGIVPLGELSRQFVDEAGWLHQDIAQHASQVDFIMAGLPLTLKGESLNRRSAEEHQ